MSIAAASRPLRIFDLSGEDITPRVISLDVNVERCIATVVVHDDPPSLPSYRFHHLGRPWTIEVRVGRIAGEHVWK